MTAGRTAAVAAAVVLMAALPAAAAQADTGDRWMRTTASFGTPGEFLAPDAVTHDEGVVPAGARITVAQRVKDGRTAVELSVRGIQPDRAYGAHVHTGTCGVAPEASGPHYQHRIDPVQPSVDPAYANPRNEAWLDFRTGPDGSGGAVAEQKWSFRAGEARSVVIHEHTTLTGKGEAGQAGRRLACFTVPFVPVAAGK
ncbi:superoxide dismutase family protein [Streptomyces sp. 549]|uniref:superoxide dismutase family protein n=1 Tax=Streptomyces sp. 549 TaxID=3049076 RepID=UPI0024C255FD|nr:superoxide dismutase family protein [Streptomyces sp. 549]MDK1473991.1 superoxide dismutase family protein [Streptomyces sp. 549]